VVPVTFGSASKAKRAKIKGDSREVGPSGSYCGGEEDEAVGSVGEVRYSATDDRSGDCRVRGSAFPPEGPDGDGSGELRGSPEGLVDQYTGLNSAVNSEELTPASQAFTRHGNSPQLEAIGTGGR
jgi:hypothetical protein